MTVPPGEPIFDAARTYPVVAAARAALRAGDWTGLQSAFLAARSQYERHLIVRLTHDLAGCESFLSAVWTQTRDPLAGTLLAAREVGLAWEARGSDRGNTVTPAMWDGFRSFLVRAEQRLIEVCARQPGFAPPWEVRLTTARGLQLGVAEARRRYQRLGAVSAHDLLGQESMQQMLLPKWFGDWDQAAHFTWQCANEAPPGSPNPALVVLFHVERWVDGEQGLSKIFADPVVRREVGQAGEMSVMNPAFGNAAGWEMALSLFALGYSLTGDWGRAKSCFQRLGPYANEAGWGYFENPEHLFLSTRRDAMSQG